MNSYVTFNDITLLDNLCFLIGGEGAGILSKIWFSWDNSSSDWTSLYKGVDGSDASFLLTIEKRIEMVSKSMILSDFHNRKYGYLEKYPLLFVKSGKKRHKITRFSLTFFSFSKIFWIFFHWHQMMCE